MIRASHHTYFVTVACYGLVWLLIVVAGILQVVKG
jgi:hypothetical protein